MVILVIFIKRFDDENALCSNFWRCFRRPSGFILGASEGRSYLIFCEKHKKPGKCEGNISFKWKCLTHSDGKQINPSISERIDDDVGDEYDGDDYDDDDDDDGDGDDDEDVDDDDEEC